MASRKPLPPRALLLAACAFALLCAAPAFAQSTPPEDQERVWGDYLVRGYVEFGGRIADKQGDENLYETLVDLHSGPRFLEQELNMHSISHQGALFDNLYTSSFGFGGDPDSMARVRVQKNRWYDFVGLYRRDKNFFDYNLFANPLNLNQGIATCGAGCTNAFTPSSLPWFSDSTRLMNMTRNMGDFSLTLAPESKVSVRLGYARNASYGLLSTTLEAPIRSLLAEDSQWRSDRYQGGVDLKMVPRTTFSIDFFFEHDKTDTGFTDAPALLYTIGNGAGQQLLFNGQPLPADIGILLPPLGGTLTIPPTGTSCPNNTAPSNQSIFTGNLFLLNAGCNGVLLNTGAGGAYFRTGNVRTNIPTGQLSMQSNYFPKLDVTASFSYSAGSSDLLNYNEFAHLNSNQPAAPAPGTVSTTNSNLFLFNGTPSADRTSANADAGAAYRISKTLSLSDKFRWVNWREPGNALFNQYGCFLPSGQAYATAAGTTGTFTSLLNPCFSGILDLVNPSGSTLIGTAGSVGNGRGNYLQTSSFASLIAERSYFNTFKVNWQPSRRFGGYVGYRYGRRSLQDGNADITGILATSVSNFVNNGTGTAPTTPQCNLATAGCDPATGIISNVGGVDSAQINQHTALVGVNVRPVDAWRINADLEWLYADNYFTNLNPRHQQRVRLYTSYKARPWLSLNGGVHLVESRNDFAAGTVQDDNGTSPGDLLFPAAFLPAAYGHKDHWRNYTAGVTVTRQAITFDLGWTMQDQHIFNATCMPIAGNAFSGTVTPPPACDNAATARALLLDYQETTHSGYTHLSYRPVKRVTLSIGYEITADNGRTNWLRADDLSPLLVVGDIYGNSPALPGNPITPCPLGSSGTGCIFPGPFPDQPLGPQATNWHKALAGVGFEVARGVELKGMWNYYDYNSKDEVPSLSLLQVTAPRDFHANVGTVSVRYSF